jgi:hypothetical protein
MRSCGREQPRPALTLKLHNNRFNISAFATSYNNFPTNLIEVCETDIAGLIQDNRSLHIAQVAPGQGGLLEIVGYNERMFHLLL